VFRSNVKDNISDRFRTVGSKQSTRKSTFCPIEYLSVSASRYRVVNSDGYEIKLSCKSLDEVH